MLKNSKYKKIVFLLLLLASFAGCNSLPKDLHGFLEDRFWGQGFWADETAIPLLCLPASFEELPKERQALLFMLKSNGELWLFAGEKMHRNDRVVLVQSCHIGSWSAMDDVVSFTFINSESRDLKMREVTNRRGLLSFCFDDPTTCFHLSTFNHILIEDSELKIGYYDEYKTFGILEKGALISIDFKYSTLANGWWRIRYNNNQVYVQAEHLEYYGGSKTAVNTLGYDNMMGVLFILIVLLSISLIVIKFMYKEWKGKILYVASGIFLAMSVAALILGYQSVKWAAFDTMFDLSFSYGYSTFVLSCLVICALAAAVYLLYNNFKSYFKILKSVQQQTSYFSCKFGYTTALLSAIAGTICHLYIFDVRYLFYVLIFYLATQLIQAGIIIRHTSPRLTHGILASLVLILGPAGFYLLFAPIILNVLKLIFILVLVVGGVCAVLFTPSSSKSGKKSKICNNCYYKEDMCSLRFKCRKKSIILEHWEGNNYYCKEFISK